MGKKSPPPAPDYTGAAEKTAAGNKELTTAQTWANRPDLFTPWGNQTWTATPGTDPSTGSPITQWASSIKLSPQQQAALDEQMLIQSKLSAGAGTLADQATRSFQQTPNWDSLPALTGSISAGSPAFSFGGSGPISTSFGGNAPIRQQLSSTAGDWRQRAQSAVEKLQAPGLARARQQAEARLANQGITVGSEAWKDVQQQLADNETRAGLGAISSGRDEANMLFGQDLQSSEFANSAQQQGFLQALARGQFGNAAQQQAFAQALARGQFGNAAQQQAFDQKTTAGNFGNMARQQAIAEMMMRRGQPLNELNALRTGNQVTMPSMPGFSSAQRSAAPDYLGAAGMKYQSDLDAYNAKAGMFGNTMGGLFSLGSAALGNPAGLAGLFRLGS